MRKMTESNLINAFAGESQAHMRYYIFANEAEKAGKPNVARLFRAIAYAEEVHATNHFKALGLLQETAANLQTAIDGENFEVNEMYPAYHEVAKLQDERDAQRTTHYALEAEKLHARLYGEAKQLVEQGKDEDGEPVYVCPVCGYTVKGNAPDKCPVCGAPASKFKKF
ncbi:MAG: rubrerythrin family protein [Limnochordaceae bacterium]|nr:rubrerythrin family protein [Limnochordaceae bacterium]